MHKLLALSHKGHTSCSAASLTFRHHALHARERDEDENMQSRHRNTLQKTTRTCADLRDSVTPMVAP